MKWCALLSFAFAARKATAFAQYDIEHPSNLALTQRDETLPTCSVSQPHLIVNVYPPRTNAHVCS